MTVYSCWLWAQLQLLCLALIGEAVAGYSYHSAFRQLHLKVDSVVLWICTAVLFASVTNVLNRQPHYSTFITSHTHVQSVFFSLTDVSQSELQQPNYSHGYSDRFVIPRLPSQSQQLQPLPQSALAVVTENWPPSSSFLSLRSHTEAAPACLYIAQINAYLWDFLYWWKWLKGGAKVLQGVQENPTFLGLTILLFLYIFGSHIPDILGHKHYVDNWYQQMAPKHSKDFIVLSCALGH